MIAIFPKIAEVARGGDIEALSCIVRSYFGGASVYKPIFDPQIVFANLSIPLEARALASLAILAGRDDSGRFIVSAQVDSEAISKMNSCQRRFLYGYLLGLYFIHMQPKIAQGEFVLGGYKELDCPLSRYLSASSSEAESADFLADRFAACLLLPKAMMKRSMEKLTPKDAARFFGVTESLLIRRSTVLAEKAALVASTTRSIEATDEQTANRNSKIISNNIGLSGMGRIREIARQLDKSPS